MIAIAVAAALAAAQPPAPDNATQTLAAVRDMYAQSCQIRAYGSYDDLCNALKKQMKVFEKAEKADARERRARGAEPASAPRPAPTPPTPAAPLTLR